MLVHGGGAGGAAEGSDGGGKDASVRRAVPGSRRSAGGQILRRPLRRAAGGETVVEDLVKGRVVFDNRQLDDLIVLRSDGTPTYNFCVVVDDVDMKITHVIRGDDHLNNTPRQAGLYRAFGFDLPKFAHVPMILGADKARLSKRHGATSVTAYREQGYLPEALVNYLARLGWSSGDQEIFSRGELIEKFDLAHVGTAPAVFNPEKLVWLNAHYIKEAERGRLGDLLSAFLPPRETWPADAPDPAAAAQAHKERSRTLVEMAESAQCYYAGKSKWTMRPPRNT